MARRGNLKMVDIRAYRHPKTGKEVQIKFDPNKNQFYASYAEIEYSSHEISNLEGQLEEAMIKDNRIAWNAVIEVTIEGREGVGIRFDRFLIGDQAGGMRFLRCDWEKNVRYEVPGKRPKDSMKVEYKTYVGLEIPEEIRVKESRGFAWNSEMRPFTPPVRARTWGDRDADMWYLPYSQATWESLVEINRRIVAIKEMLRTLLNTEQGRARLEAGARLELPPKGQPSSDKEKDD